MGNDEIIWRRKINGNINRPTDDQKNLLQSAFLKLQQSKAEFCNDIYCEAVLLVGKDGKR